MKNKYSATKTSRQPLILIIVSVQLESCFMFLSPDVNMPAIISITPCPIANKKSITIAAKRFFPIAAKTIMPANIGVEHGVPASAYAIPSSNGYKTSELVLFCGIDFIITGISKSKIPMILSPITIKRDAIIRVKYPPKTDAKTLPVMAQSTPITVKTTEVPRIKQLSCTKVRNGVSLEHPPTYPIISGSIASEQGEIDAIIPPANAVTNIKSNVKNPVFDDANIFTKLSIY